MPEIMSFDDTTRVMYRGVTGHRDPPSTQKPWTSPRKRPEMPEITSFDYAARFMYRGSRGIEILPGAKNRGM